ncbi:MAG: amino acid ABC transporter substrate-binding protein, partial [Gammaproteobacteria bacterium]
MNPLRITPHVLACAVLVLGALVPISSQAGRTLDGVKARGIVRCGVSEGISGFSERDAAGRWRGMDVDFCRAVAAAALGDAGKVKLVPLKASERFPALQADAIDLLLRETTWTLGREARLKVLFPAVLYFDAQALMVPAKAGVKALADLDGAMICVEKGTTPEGYLPDYFAAHGLDFRPLVFDSSTEVAEAFFDGRCRAYASDASQLAAARLHAPGGAQAFVILPEPIGKEPLGPVVRYGDDDWFTLVRWVLFALIAAEEVGVTRENAARLRDTTAHPV